MHETTERRFACPTCHAERSEASTLGFLADARNDRKSVRDDRENARKLPMEGFSCATWQAERSEGHERITPSLGNRESYGMTEKMHETTERRFACPTCHAERSEASTLGFLADARNDRKSVRDNAKKCTE